jgi:transcriptional regulator with XRE-family HTH domain
MSVRQSTGSRRVFSASNATQVIAETLKAIKEEDGMTYADLGRVLGKGADAASNYCEGSAEMGVIAFMLAWREWNGRWSGPVKRFCEETRPKAVDDRIASHAVLSAATALSQALSDGNMLDAEDIRKNRAALEQGRDALEALLAKLKPEAA